MLCSCVWDWFSLICTKACFNKNRHTGQSRHPGTQTRDQAPMWLGEISISPLTQQEVGGWERQTCSLCCVLPCLGKHYDSPSQSHYHNINHPSSPIHDPCDYPATLLTHRHTSNKTRYTRNRILADWVVYLSETMREHVGLLIFPNTLWYHSS